MQSIDVTHGNIKTRGYLFKQIAYLSDCNKIPKSSLKKLKNLNYLIIDCFRINKHATHLNLDESLELIKYLKPKKAILTNMHVDLDYEKLKKILPKNVVPAYDGMSINF